MKTEKLNDKYDVLKSEFGWTLIERKTRFGIYFENYDELLRHAGVKA